MEGQTTGQAILEKLVAFEVFFCPLHCYPPAMWLNRTCVDCGVRTEVTDGGTFLSFTSQFIAILTTTSVDLLAPPSSCREQEDGGTGAAGLHVAVASAVRVRVRVRVRRHNPIGTQNTLCSMHRNNLAFLEETKPDCYFAVCTQDG